MEYNERGKRGVKSGTLEEGEWSRGVGSRRKQSVRVRVVVGDEGGSFGVYCCSCFCWCRYCCIATARGWEWVTRGAGFLQYSSRVEGGNREWRDFIDDGRCVMRSRRVCEGEGTDGGEMARRR